MATPREQHQSRPRVRAVGAPPIERAARPSGSGEGNGASAADPNAPASEPPVGSPGPDQGADPAPEE